MSNVIKPRLHSHWRELAADREEDAANLFGYYLVKHCREAALAKVRSASSMVPRSVAVEAVDIALHNVMDLLEGFWQLDAGEGKQLELALHIQVTKDGQTAEDIRVSPSQIDLPIGYWAWVDTYGSTPTADAQL
jgi:hypothetical protein